MFATVLNRFTEEMFKNGTAEGGAYDRATISYVICWALRSCCGGADREMLLGMLLKNEVCNYFEAGVALEMLVKNGMVTETPSGRVVLTEKGLENINILKGEIPKNLREIAERESSRLLPTDDVTANITECDGRFAVDFAVRSDGKNLIELRIYTQTVEEAFTLRSSVCNNPGKFRKAVFNAVT